MQAQNPSSPLLRGRVTCHTSGLAIFAPQHQHSPTTLPGGEDNTHKKQHANTASPAGVPLRISGPQTPRDAFPATVPESPEPRPIGHDFGARRDDGTLREDDGAFREVGVHWVVQWSHSKQRNYYYNTETGESVWKPRQHSRCVRRDSPNPRKKSPNPRHEFSPANLPSKSESALFSKPNLEAQWLSEDTDVSYT